MYRYMAVLAIVLVFAVGGVAHAGIWNDGDLSNWGNWVAGNFVAYDLWDPTGPYGNGDALWASNFAAENNKLTFANAGGEWYDIEGMYVSVTHDLGRTYLNWAVITSYAGMEPGEWNPNNWAAANPESNGTYSPDSGLFAGQRNGANIYGHTYHQNPVIGLSLDGDMSYEWGVVFGEVPGANQRDSALSTTPILYQINDAGVWNYWVNSVDYPGYEKAVDFSEASAGVTAKVTGVAGDTVRLWDSAHSELPAVQTDYPGGDSPDKSRMDYNWIWEGSLDVTGQLALDGNPATPSFAHYSMWCGNDGIFQAGTERLDRTPELGTWALLGCTGLLGLCSVGWRRRRVS